MSQGIEINEPSILGKDSVGVKIDKGESSKRDKGKCKMFEDITFPNACLKLKDVSESLMNQGQNSKDKVFVT